MPPKRKASTSHGSVKFVVPPPAENDVPEETTRIRTSGVAAGTDRTTKARTIAMDLAGWVVIGHQCVAVETTVMTADRFVVEAATVTNAMIVARSVVEIVLRCATANAAAVCVGKAATVIVATIAETVGTLAATVTVGTTVQEDHVVMIVVAIGTTPGVVELPVAAAKKVATGETLPDRNRPNRRKNGARNDRRRPAAPARMRTAGRT